MCFSAKASFAASGVLSVIGLLSIRKATTTKELIPLGSTPLLFALQQAAEGFVWITINNSPVMHSALHSYAAYSYLFFAGAWWPFWIPITLYRLEKNEGRKKILFILLIIGTVTSLLFLISMATQPLKIMVTNHHLYYSTLSSPFGNANTITHFIGSIIPEMYLLSTVMPFFVSSMQYMWISGIVMSIACLTSQIIYAPSSASTWCFFAAIISSMIYFIIVKYQQNR